MLASFLCSYRFVVMVINFSIEESEVSKISAMKTENKRITVKRLPRFHVTSSLTTKLCTAIVRSHSLHIIQVHSFRDSTILSFIKSLSVLKADAIIAEQVEVVE